MQTMWHLEFHSSYGSLYLIKIIQVYKIFVLKVFPTSGVHVKFKGEAHTEWYESKQQENSEGKTESTDTMHSGNEEYFQITYYLLGSNSGN